jgi:pre-mRNA-splicing factor ATP-dependent RNA helicase DHX16
LGGYLVRKLWVDKLSRGAKLRSWFATVQGMPDPTSKDVDTSPTFSLKRSPESTLESSSSEKRPKVDLPEANRQERERLQDLKDRDALAERIRERDKERTKKIVEDRSSRKSGAAAADAAHRRHLAEDADAGKQALPSLRLHSRQEYLTKRELQQVELLRKEIQDDEALFHGMKISKHERRELEGKKELLQLIEERLNIADTFDGYQLPEDYLTEQGKIDSKKKQNVLYKRYEEAKAKDGQFVTDIDQWETHQTQHSTVKTGAMDKREIIDEYEYVFDESQTIKFVMENALGGVGRPMNAAEKLLQSQIEEAEKRGNLLRLIKAMLLKVRI